MAKQCDIFCCVLINKVFANTFSILYTYLIVELCFKY